MLVTVGINTPDASGVREFLRDSRIHASGGEIRLLILVESLHTGVVVGRAKVDLPADGLELGINTQVDPEAVLHNRAAQREIRLDVAEVIRLLSG
jgi:hypothetical protein